MTILPLPLNLQSSNSTTSNTNNNGVTALTIPGNYSEHAAEVMARDFIMVFNADPDPIESAIAYLQQLKSRPSYNGNSSSNTTNAALNSLALGNNVNLGASTPTSTSSGTYAGFGTGLGGIGLGAGFDAGVKRRRGMMETGELNVGMNGGGQAGMGYGGYGGRSRGPPVEGVDGNWRCEVFLSLSLSHVPSFVIWLFVILRGFLCHRSPRFFPSPVHQLC